MARPIKKGLDYFPLDVILDDDMKLIEARYGLKGFAIIVKLYQKIYGELGYYCEWTKEVESLFAYYNHAGGGFVSEIIEASISRGIFDGNVFQKFNVLTSRGIQERYLKAVERRKKIELKKEYLLLTIPEIREIVDENSINVNINSINGDINSQIKLKEIKEDNHYISDETDEEPLIDKLLLREALNAN